MAEESPMAMGGPFKGGSEKRNGARRAMLRDSHHTGDSDTEDASPTFGARNLYDALQKKERADG